MRPFQKAALRLAWVAGMLALVMLLPGAGAQNVLGLEATVVKIKRPSKVFAYPSVDLGRSPRAGDDRATTTRWRVVNDTGNCCENYLTTTPQGRLLDFGGSYINYTDDRGKTWHQVQPMEPLVNGEGTIALAPGGDIVGVEWDPYSGDHLLSFKYEAKDKKWYYNEIPVHTPFFDREWIVAVPGPFKIGPVKAPYVTFLKGAWPSKELWYFSTDGVNYTQVSSKFADATINGSRVKKIKPVAAPENDWTQPNTNMGVTPLGNGAAMAAPDWPFSGGERWTILGKDLRWRPFKFGKDAPQGLYQLDSEARLHNVVPQRDQFLYRISSNAGRSWKQLKVALPKDHVIENIDFRANLAAGVAAVAIHSHDRGAKKDRDILYKFDISKDRARATDFYQIGKADIDGSSGVGADIRFDFETVTIFRDGRVAVSFYDSTTRGKSPTTGAGRIQPAVAIELG